MDAFARRTLEQLPLVEAVMHCCQWALESEALQQIFQEHRGRSYQDTLTFENIVQLVGSALIDHGGSGNQAFTRAAEADELEVSKEAVYGKLRRLPIPLSTGFLRATTKRFAELLPHGARKHTHIPESLRHLEILFVDGKKIKQVPRLLKAARRTTKAVLGGKTLSALSWNTGLVVAMHANPDGEASDAPLVPGLLAQLQEHAEGRERLYVEDRQFCDLNHPRLLLETPGNHFLIRYSNKVKFHRDKSVKLRRDRDDQGHAILEEWGWIGNPQDPRCCYVRRITLKRPVTTDNPQGEPLRMITDLLDAKKYPAVDLLKAYRGRWGLECVFQKITEVFHLNNLISTTPEGTVFQFAFCLMLYNLIQLLTQYLAESQDLEPEKISQEKLFYDVHKQLSAWHTVLDTTATVPDWQPLESAAAVRWRLKQLLRTAWTSRWLKAPKKKRASRHPGYVHISGTHTSMYRLIHGHTSSPRRKAKAK